MTENDRETQLDRFNVMYDESLKQGFELAKHLTTLNAGSIVLIATFLKDIFPNKNGALDIGLLDKRLIAASFALFGISLLISGLFMYRYSMGEAAFEADKALSKGKDPKGSKQSTDITEIEEKSKRLRGSRVVLLLGIFGAFFLGVFCFGAAVLRHLL